ncbi:MAG: DUF1189 family protein [Desulfobacterales bacterium]|jgi:hypothetical protein
MPPVDDLPIMERYDLIFEGEIQDGTTVDQVKKNLARLYGVDPRRIDAIFTGKPVTIKKAMDLVSALEDKETFEATGAILRLEPTKETVGGTGGDVRPGEAAGRTTVSKTAKVPPKAGLPPGAGSSRWGFHQAFYSREFYRSAARRWKRHAIVYLLVLSLVYTVSAVYRLKMETADILNASLPLLAQQIPEITIDRGRVRIDADEPYLIKGPGNGEVVAILDTTGQYRDLSGTKSVVLLTADRLYVRRGAESVKEIDLSTVDGFHLNRDRMMAWMSSMVAWMPVMVFPFAAVAAFGLRLVQAIIFGAVGMAMTLGLKRPIPFQAAFSIAAAALTPAILLDAVFNFLGVAPPYWGIISQMVTAGYLIHGIKAAMPREEA